MAINLVKYGNSTLIDLTPTTATASDVASGKVFFGADGVQTSGIASLGLVYEQGTWTPNSDVTNTTINWSNTHTDAPMLFMLTDTTGTNDTTSNTCFGLTFADFYKLGGLWSYASNSWRYGQVIITYRSTSTTQTTYAGVMFTYPSTNTGSSGTGYPRYWCNNTRAYVYSNNTSRYWRSGRTYKWVAIWAPGES